MMHDGALTADQLTHIQGVRDDWMRVGVSTERCDRPAAEAAVRAVYTAAGLVAPTWVVWADSPLGGARAVLDQPGDRLWDEVGGHLCPWRDAYWLAYHQVARPIAGLPPSPQLDALAAATRAVGWWWPMRDVAVLTDRPTQLHRDEQGRLHREGGPAVAYADGWALHYRHGTPHPALTAGETL
ncbi:DUF6745 domain-containing protein [Pseudonocardia hispaniensis]|uniref:DUF6745 domain-containing protein n=1 Tax=Pseudonocardia hispaniensis TaxID=904933 RepID=A0ABW1J7Q0_9PSEU